ncbi:hypothetical protein ACP8HZ_00880 [Francisella noatunensis]
MQEGNDDLNIKGARTLLMLGDSVTTDHIWPAGAIPRVSCWTISKILWC